MFTNPQISTGISSSLFSETSMHVSSRSFPISGGRCVSWLWSNQSSVKAGSEPMCGGYKKKLKLTKNWVQVKFVRQISYSPQMVQVRVGVLGLKIGFWPEKGVKVKKSWKTAKFGNNIGLRKQNFLSPVKISDRSRFLTNVNNEDIFNKLCEMSLFTKRERSLIFSLQKIFCFLKSMLLLKFQIQWCLNILNLLNILMSNKSIFRWFQFNVTTKAHL